MAAMISFHQARWRASHQASGVATRSSKTVVTTASLTVVQITSSIVFAPRGCDIGRRGQARLAT
jgi:hypothetical protein